MSSDNPYLVSSVRWAEKRYLWACHLYYNDGYNSYAGTIDNYTGTTLRYAASINIYGSQNQINSCKLYYLNDSNEITNDLIS